MGIYIILLPYFSFAKIQVNPVVPRKKTGCPMIVSYAEDAGKLGSQVKSKKKWWFSSTNR